MLCVGSLTSISAAQVTVLAGGTSPCLVLPRKAAYTVLHNASQGGCQRAYRQETEATPVLTALEIHLPAFDLAGLGKTY